MSDNVRHGDFEKITDVNLLSDIREIGDGGYSTVKYAYHKHRGPLAIKMLKDISHCNGNYKEQLLKEMEIHSSIIHTNVVQFYGYVAVPEYRGIAMEYLPNGSLGDFLDNNKEKYVEKEWHPLKNQWASDVASGMCFIHNRTPIIIHLDLKVNNVLLDHGFKAKITDFGISEYRRMTGTSCPRNSNGARGTLQYTSPEMFSNINIDPAPAMDVYAFAILLWELYTEKVAFSNARDERHISLSVREGMRPSEDLLKQYTPTRIQDLVKHCWSSIPADRPKFQDISQLLLRETNIGDFKVCLTQMLLDRPSAPMLSQNNIETDGPSSVDGILPLEDMSLREQQSAERSHLQSLHQQRGPQLTSIPVQRRTNTLVNQTDYSHLSDFSGFQNLHPHNNDTGDIKKPGPNSFASNILQSVPPVRTPDGLAAMEDLKGKSAVGFTEEPRTLPHLLQNDLGQREIDLMNQQRLEIAAKQQSIMDASTADPAVDAVCFSEKSSLPDQPSMTSFASSAPTSSPFPSEKQKSFPSEPSSSLQSDQPGRIHFSRGDGVTKTDVTISGSNGGHVFVGDNNTLIVYSKGSNGASCGPVPGNRAQKRPKKKITVEQKLSPDEAIKFLSKHVGSRWRDLGRKLGYTNGELDAIHHDYYNSGLQEVIYQMLFQWKLREGDAASLKALVYALVGSKMGQLGEKMADF